MSDCNHTKDGKSTIVFDTKKRFGVYPVRVKGICSVCGKQFNLSLNEYNNIKESGDTN